MKLINKLMRILQHLNIILALAFLGFIVLDYFNPMMAFTTNSLSTKLLIALCIATIISSTWALNKK